MRIDQKNIGRIVNFINNCWEKGSAQKIAIKELQSSNSVVTLVCADKYLYKCSNCTKFKIDKNTKQHTFMNLIYQSQIIILCARYHFSTCELFSLIDRVVSEFFWQIFPCCCLRYKNPTIKQHPHYVTSNFTPINSLIKVQLKSAARILCFVLLRCNIPFSVQTGSFQYETNILNFRYLLLVSCIYFQKMDINTIWNELRSSFAKMNRGSLFLKKSLAYFYYSMFTITHRKGIL